jgi:hypothetical protein
MYKMSIPLAPPEELEPEEPEESEELEVLGPCGALPDVEPPEVPVPGTETENDVGELRWHVEMLTARKRECRNSSAQQGPVKRQTR